MSTIQTETLYKKVGRRYIPVNEGIDRHDLKVPVEGNTMNGPERLSHLKLCGIETTAEELIDKEVDRLLAALYIPTVTEDGRLIYQRDPVRCELFGIEEESINWGDLKCSQVDAFADGRYRIIIEEASPGGCPSLCEYVSHHLRINGWVCEVSTEW